MLYRLWSFIRSIKAALVGRIFLEFNKSIGRRIILSFVPFMILVIIGICIVSYYKFSDTLEKQVIDDTGKIIEQVGINTDFYFKDVMTPMAMLVRNTYVVKALKDYYKMDTKEKLFLERDIAVLTSNINIFKSYMGDLIIAGKNGFTANLASSSNMVAGYDFFSAPWMKEVVSSNKEGIHFIPPHKCDYYYPSVKPYDMAISAVLPVKQGQEVMGYIICDINIKGLNSIFDSLKFVKGGLIYMVDREGKTVFHPDPVMIGSEVNSSVVSKVLSGDSGSFTYGNSQESILVVYSKSSRTGWVLVAEIPYENIRKPAFQILNSIYIILIVAILFTGAMSYVISINIKKPLNDLVERIQKVQNHDFKTYERDFGYGEIAFLRREFEGMVSEIDTLINDVYVSKMRQREAEFEALQSQINPHFIYNALQLVKSEAVFSGNREISSIVTSLGYLLRYAINTKNELAKVSEEIEYISNYLEIYKKRFEDKFTYSISVDNSLMNYRISKLILQPIVENCLKHGLINTKAGGSIRITIKKQTEHIVFEVHDNGTGLSDSDIKLIMDNIDTGSSESNIGLKNVNSRLKLRYGELSGIRIISEKGSFTTVTFSIPA